MNKIIFVFCLLATSFAHADRSRLRALNQDPNGSMYIMDARNIFLNPAQITTVKDSMNLEWGAGNRPGTDNMPDAEGGFIYTLGAGKLGVQLGRIDDFSQRVHDFNSLMSGIVTNTLGSNYGEGQNNIDILYGGGTQSLRWGAGLGVTRSKNAVGGATASHLDQNVQAYDLRAGVYNDMWEAYGSLLLGAKSETDLPTTTAKYDESIGVRAGGGFQFKPYLRGFAHLTYDKYESSVGGGHDYTGKNLDINVGAAYMRDVGTNNARFFLAGEIVYVDDSASDSLNAPTEKFSGWLLPVTMGIEADGNSWLRLRGSIRQNVLLGNLKATAGMANAGEQYYENAPNLTQVAFGAGASLNAFNFDVALIQAVLGSDSPHVEASMSYLF